MISASLKRDYYIQINTSPKPGILWIIVTKRIRREITKTNRIISHNHSTAHQKIKNAENKICKFLENHSTCLE